MSYLYICINRLKQIFDFETIKIKKTCIREKQKSKIY